MALVKKGLKVGDTFEENGIEYTVTRVLVNGNYISKKVVKVTTGKKNNGDGDTV